MLFIEELEGRASRENYIAEELDIRFDELMRADVRAASIKVWI
jgi:hypothetical protein